jgi:SAM-dependent methyltransferase
MKWRGFPRSEGGELPRDDQARTIDFGRTADDYERHRPGFPVSFFDRIFAEHLVKPGQRALDLGTGTGAMALGLAERGVHVTALDRSPELLEVLARRAKDANAPIKLKQGLAEDTGEADASFEVVTAAQCWWWFDPVRTTREVRRVLIPGGRLILAAFCYLPLPNSVAYETEELILEHNPGWTAAGCQGIFPEQLTQISAGGFRDITSFSYDLEVLFTHEGWRGRIRACNGVAASLSPKEVQTFDRALAAHLEKRWPGELSVLHRVFVVSGVS